MQLGFVFELKALSDAGTFEGLASVYGNVDSVGDVVLPGAFTRTLAAGKERPLLLQHRDPIGVVSLSDSPAGLRAAGRLTLGVQKAQEAYALLRDGALKGLSIGFETIKSDYSGAVRQLKEVKLWEVSLTPLPANQLAAVSEVKSRDSAQLRAVLDQFARETVRAIQGGR